MILNFKILGYRKAQRYAVRRSIEQALMNIPVAQNNCTVNIEEVKDVAEILKYTQVLIYPSLVLNEKLICVGRIPGQKEMQGLIVQEIENLSQADH